MDMHTRYTKMLLTMTALSCLGACTGKLDDPGQLANRRLQVQSEQYARNVSSHEMGPANIAALADDYKRYGGDGALNITVQYDPKSSRNTAMTATNEATRISRELRREGVTNVAAEILPVMGLGEQGRTLVSYDAYSAHPPSNCGEMPGLNNTSPDWKAGKNYEFGCSVETRIAKQVARPADLMGRGAHYETSDGRRAGNVLDGYRAGIPNEKLDSDNASDD